MTRVFTALGLAFIGLLTVAIGIWGTLALAFAGPQHEILRYSLAGAYAVISLATVITLAIRHSRWRMFGIYLALFISLLVWFFSLEPSNERNWQTDVAVLPYATVEGDSVTVHNIRNFSYRSETDYTPAYYDKRFELAKLEGVDVVAVYWMGPAIAHVFLSFAFEGGDHLAISIETRKEKNEAYSTLKGFFRQYELYYVVADERDVIRLRTNYRHNPPEDVYVYRAAAPIENGRRLFMQYIKRINSLKSEPKFYNTLTSNCTTTIWMNTHVNQSHIPFSWKILASGYLPEYMYEQGRLDAQGRSFSVLQRNAHVNARAQAADADINFSRRIRENLESTQPEPPPVTGETK
jgi:hypothetical protein